MNRELREAADEMIKYVLGRDSGSTEPTECAEPDMTCPACGEPKVHVVTLRQYQYWVCEHCEMSSRVDTAGDALADLAWWQDAARMKREAEVTG